MILNALRGTTSRIMKEKILSLANANELKMFNYAYDKNKVYHRRFSNMHLDGPLQSPCDEDFALLDKLLSGSISGLYASDMVELHCLTHGPLVKLICNKDLDCGVTATLINKVKPCTVPVFKVQLAKEQPLCKVALPVQAELKYDGVRIVIIKQTESVSFWTRNGKEVHLPKCASIVNAIMPINFMLDCEVTLREGKMDDRTKVSGMINSAMHGGVIDESLLQFNIFDSMSLYEFNIAKCPNDYESRRFKALSFVNEIDNEQFSLAKSWTCTTVEAIQNVYDSLITEGYEGLILKNSKSKYLFKRTPEWTKMKETKTADLRCMSVEEGTGKYTGLIGALVCEGVVDNKFVVVRLGSGLSDLQRSLPEQRFVDKTIEMKYNTLIQDKNTLAWSLFLPRFVAVRYDK